jgi:2-hydroxy-3-oxopropionate reductase
MSSIAVDAAKRQGSMCKAAGIEYLDAPVSGGVVGAEGGTLAIMAGCGSPSAPQPVSECLAVLGTATLVGGVGAGSTAKLINQTIVACQMTAISDAFKLATASGIDLSSIPTALAGGFADSKVLQLRWPRLIEANFVPGGPSKLMTKDLRNTMAAAESCGLAAENLPAVSAALAAFAKLETETFNKLSPRSGDVAPGAVTVEGGDLDLCAVSLVL